MWGILLSGKLLSLHKQGRRWVQFTVQEKNLTKNKIGLECSLMIA